LVKIRQLAREIPEATFAAPVGTPAGLEVLSVAELRARAAGNNALPSLVRLDFHHLFTLSSGSLRHTVDFTEYVLEPGRWLWLRPGQVLQVGDHAQAEGTVILFDKDFLDPATTAAARLDETHSPVLLIPADEDAQALRYSADHLYREFRSRSHGLPVHVHIVVLRHLLAGLLLRLAYLAPGAHLSAAEPNETFLRFRDAVERDFARTRRIEDYARALGYSPRTLARAALAATGIGAKEFIDRRVILDAKRLLAHEDRSASAIAARLGFSSAANFTKYFHQRTGQTPLAFRATVRGQLCTARGNARSTRRPG
jgi:AraC-like DNA-binding protein